MHADCGWPHCCRPHAGLSDRAAAARQRLLKHQQAQALSQAPSLSGLLYGSQQTSSVGGGRSAPGAGPAADGDDEQRLPLAVRLKLPADGAADGSLLPMQLLRKYIAYAREHVHPVLSDEAKDILQVNPSAILSSVDAPCLRGEKSCAVTIYSCKCWPACRSSHPPSTLWGCCGNSWCAMQIFYLSLRSSSCGGISGSLPITARQLESLVRLAEARARVELRETVTADDAQVCC